MIPFLAVMVTFVASALVVVAGLYWFSQTKRDLARMTEESLRALRSIPVAGPLPPKELLDDFPESNRLTDVYQLFNGPGEPRSDQLALCLNRDELRWHAVMENGHVRVTFEPLGKPS